MSRIAWNCTDAYRRRHPGQKLIQINSLSDRETKALAWYRVSPEP
jgi:hypothetical protein